MGVLDDYMVSANVSFLDKTRIQAQVLVPVLRVLREELGRDKAHALVRRALRDWSRDLFTEIGAGIEGSKWRKWATVQSAYNTVSSPGIEFEVLRHDKEAMEIDVTRCPFAEFFRALGEPELGALLICETDFDIVATGGGAVTLTREQTIMHGAPSCTFRYRIPLASRHRLANSSSKAAWCGGCVWLAGTCNRFSGLRAGEAWTYGPCASREHCHAKQCRSLGPMSARPRGQSLRPSDRSSTFSPNAATICLERCPMAEIIHPFYESHRGAMEAAMRHRLDLAEAMLCERAHLSDIDGIRQEVKDEFEIVLTQMPYVAGAANRMSDFFIRLMGFMAISRVLRRHGLSLSVIGEIERETYKAQLLTVPEAERAASGQEQTSRNPVRPPGPYIENLCDFPVSFLLRLGGHSTGLDIPPS